MATPTTTPTHLHQPHQGQPHQGQPHGHRSDLDRLPPNTGQHRNNTDLLQDLLQADVPLSSKQPTIDVRTTTDGWHLHPQTTSEDNEPTTVPVAELLTQLRQQPCRRCTTELADHHLTSSVRNYNHLCKLAGNLRTAQQADTDDRTPFSDLAFVHQHHQQLTDKQRHVLNRETNPAAATHLQQQLHTIHTTWRKLAQQWRHTHADRIAHQLLLPRQPGAPACGLRPFGRQWQQAHDLLYQWWTTHTPQLGPHRATTRLLELINQRKTFGDPSTRHTWRPDADRTNQQADTAAQLAAAWTNDVTRHLPDNLSTDGRDQRPHLIAALGSPGRHTSMLQTLLAHSTAHLEGRQHIVVFLVPHWLVRPLTDRTFDGLVDTTQLRTPTDLGAAPTTTNVRQLLHTTAQLAADMQSEPSPPNTIFTRALQAATTALHT